MIASRLTIKNHLFFDSKVWSKYSYDEWIKLIHDHAIEKYGEMAQEI